MTTDADSAFYVLAKILRVLLNMPCSYAIYDKSSTIISNPLWESKKNNKKYRSVKKKHTHKFKNLFFFIQLHFLWVWAFGSQPFGVRAPIHPWAHTWAPVPRRDPNPSPIWFPLLVSRPRARFLSRAEPKHRISKTIIIIYPPPLILQREKIPPRQKFIREKNNASKCFQQRRTHTLKLLELSEKFSYPLH